MATKSQVDTLLDEINSMILKDSVPRSGEDFVYHVVDACGCQEDLIRSALMPMVDLVKLKLDTHRNKKTWKMWLREAAKASVYLGLSRDWVNTHISRVPEPNQTVQEYDPMAGKTDYRFKGQTATSAPASTSTSASTEGKAISTPDVAEISSIGTAISQPSTTSAQKSSRPVVGLPEPTPDVSGLSFFAEPMDITVTAEEEALLLSPPSKEKVPSPRRSPRLAKKGKGKAQERRPKQGKTATVSKPPSEKAISDSQKGEAPSLPSQGLYKGNPPKTSRDQKAPDDSQTSRRGTAISQKRKKSSHQPDLAISHSSQVEPRAKALRQSSTISQLRKEPGRPVGASSSAGSAKGDSQRSAISQPAQPAEVHVPFPHQGRKVTLGRGMTIAVPNPEFKKREGEKLSLSKDLLKKSKVTELLGQIKEAREQNREGSKKVRTCIVPGCNSAEARYAKPHAFLSHIPGIFSDSQPSDHEDVCRRRVKALEQAARWLLGRPATLVELLGFLRMQHMSEYVSGSKLDSRYTRGMEALCRHIQFDVPQEFSLSALNSPGVLIFWKIVLFIAASLSEEERDYWRANFPALDLPSEGMQDVDEPPEPEPVYPEAIDSHFHLDRTLLRLHLAPQGTVTNVLEAVSVPEEERVNLVGAVAIYCDPRTYPSAQQLADTVEDLVFAVGLHPRHACLSRKRREEAIHQIADLLRLPRVKALGEIGIDRTEPVSEWSLQLTLLEEILPVLEPQHVLVLHCRGMEGDDGTEAYLQLLSFVRRFADRQQRVHLHCFSGNSYTKDRWLATFPNSYFGFTNLVRQFQPEQSEALRQIDESRLLLETDAPYFNLTGGRASTPGHVFRVARELATVRGCDPDHILEVTKVNARRLYWE